MEEFLMLMEKRLLAYVAQRRVEEPTPRPGSKQAVLRHFGIIKDDDLAEQLELIRKQREAGG
jgi:hypothetical protein